MKKLLLCLVVFGIAVVLAGQVYAADETAASKKTSSEKAVAVNAGNNICPVSGEKVGQGGMSPATYEYEGKIYNFCCAMCISTFKKDPEKYMKVVEDELKAQDKKVEKMMQENMHEHKN